MPASASKPFPPTSTSARFSKPPVFQRPAISPHCWRAQKALSVSSRQPGRFVVGADQTLARGARLFSKPAGRAQAAEQLRALAGGSHELHSAVAVARDGEILFEGVAVARMTMRQLGEPEITAYLDEAGEAVTVQRRRLPA